MLEWLEMLSSVEKVAGSNLGLTSNQLETFIHAVTRYLFESGKDKVVKGEG